jgi:hypothetical protein
MDHDSSLRWHLVWWSALCLAVMWLTAQHALASALEVRPL